MLRALSILLVPWTLLLMLAPAERTFGAEWVKLVWVHFDVCVALALFRVLRKPAPRLLTALCIAVSADAVTSTLEAVLWNLPHAQSALDYPIIPLPCAGPTLAAIVLWGARGHRLSVS